MGACGTFLSIKVLEGCDSTCVVQERLNPYLCDAGLLYSIPLMAEVLKLLKQQG